MMITSAIIEKTFNIKIGGNNYFWPLCLLLAKPGSPGGKDSEANTAAIIRHEKAASNPGAQDISAAAAAVDQFVRIECFYSQAEKSKEALTAM